jgi:predicted transcriptional regulator
LSIFISRENSLKSKGLIVEFVQSPMKGSEQLALSRMEMYLAIIRILDHADSITQQQVTRKAGLGLVLSKEFFDFLVRLDIIMEKTVGSKTVYSLTDKGQRLCNYFGLDDDNPIFRGTGIFRID